VCDKTDLSALRRATPLDKIPFYDHRSKAAHGDAEPDMDPYVDTFTAARRVLMKMVESRHVPSKKELEARLFGDELGIVEQKSAIH
jgi:hypothetical protein